MTKFQPIKMQSAILKGKEKHLHSFSGQVCVWETKQKYFIFGATIGYFPRSPLTILFYYRGHITNKRLILELPKKPNSLVIGVIKLLGDLSGTKIGQVVSGVSNELLDTSTEMVKMRGEQQYISIPFKEISRIMYYKPNHTFWAVRKGDSTGLGVPFVPKYPNEDGKPVDRLIYATDEELEDFSKIISRLSKLQFTDKEIKV